MQPRYCHRADSVCFKIKAHLLIHAHVSDPVIRANGYTCVWMDFSTGWFLNFASNAPSSQLDLLRYQVFIMEIVVTCSRTSRQWTSTSSTLPIGFQGSASRIPHINIYVHQYMDFFRQVQHTRTISNNFNKFLKPYCSQEIQL